MEQHPIEIIEIYRKLSVKGLIARLEESVRKERSSVSRNTILLAFKLGETTHLRKLIIEKGKQLLAESEVVVPVSEDQIFS